MKGSWCLFFSTRRRRFTREKKDGHFVRRHSSSPATGGNRFEAKLEKPIATK